MQNSKIIPSIAVTVIFQSVVQASVEKKLKRVNYAATRWGAVTRVVEASRYFGHRKPSVGRKSRFLDDGHLCNCYKDLSISCYRTPIELIVSPHCKPPSGLGVVSHNARLRREIFT